jgi:acetolactate synthase-1/2/3 large subunit
MEESQVRSTVADDIAATLRRHEVDIVFAQSIPSALLLATPKVGIRQVTYRTENAGGAMADAYARLTGKPGIVCGQNGPAATLLVAPLAEALKASIPVIALVQEVGAKSRGRNAFQEIDHYALFAGCTKSIQRLDEPSRVDDVLDAAFTSACSGRPGPVVVLLPRDVLSMASTTRTLRVSSIGHFPLDRTRPDPARITEAALLIAHAERPLLVAGGGVHVSGAHQQVSMLQSEFAIPVATTNMGKGAVDERHELSLGVIGNAMGKKSPTHFLRDYVRSADVVILVGTRTNENGTDAWTLFSSDTKFIHLDLDSAEVGRNYEALRVVGDARLGLEDLATACRQLDMTRVQCRRDAVAEEIAQAHHLHDLEALDAVTSDASPLRPERVATELNRLLTPETVVVSDASYSTLWMTLFLTSLKSGQRFISPRGLAGLGWGLPMSLGAKLARPDDPVICLVGDGGFAHVWSELETAVRCEIPVTVILFNNGILGFQKHAELFVFNEHTTAIPFSNVDHCAMARACGAEAVRVESSSQLSEVLRSALEIPRVTLIEIMTEPDAYPPITLWDQSHERLVATR